VGWCQTLHILHLALHLYVSMIHISLGGGILLCIVNWRDVTPLSLWYSL
jgi:hypothetical protein